MNHKDKIESRSKNNKPQRTQRNGKGEPVSSPENGQNLIE
jgi:hypothetical protein